MAIGWREAGQVVAVNDTNGSLTLTIPADVQKGDGLLMFVGIAAAVASAADLTVSNARWQLAPTGISVVSTLSGAAWRMPVKAGDAGSTVTVALSGGSGVKIRGFILPYSLTDPVDPFAMIKVATASGVASRSTPLITPPSSIAGAWGLQIDIAKNSGTETDYTAVPSGTLRCKSLGTLGGHINMAAVDSNAPITANGSATYGGGVYSETTSGPSITYTLALLPKGTTMAAKPYRDATVDGWAGTPSPALGVPLAADAGDLIRDDASYIESSVDPSSEVLVLKLQPMPDPQVSTGHTFEYEIGTAGGATSSSVLVELIQFTADTVIASWTETNLPDGVTARTKTLTSEQADAITNYEDLALRITATAA
jgi:hypothetical protein